MAEDERITRRTLQRQLERLGHEVVAAEDGEEAWARYQDEPFDIVVTDWEMPRLDGRELIKRIRGVNESSYVYIIMLTGRAEKSDVVVGMEAGADDFVSKPFDQEELRVRLHAGERIIELERTLAANNEALLEANVRMSRDLDAAAEMQQDLLPNDLPSLAARFAWHYEPCDELGGDILNVMPLSESVLAMYLLDVTGHGVPAALLSVTLSRVLTTRGPSSALLTTDATGDGQAAITAPRLVAESLNKTFQMSSQRGRFFTLAYAVVDLETGVLQYTVAGHPPPVLIRGDQPAAHLEGIGFPVGIVDEPEYEDHTVQLQPGDRLYFYSDGITEAANASGAMLGMQGLLDLIDDSRSLPLEESLKKAMRDLKAWCESTPYSDDISILALQVPES